MQREISALPRRLGRSAAVGAVAIATAAPILATSPGVASASHVSPQTVTAPGGAPTANARSAHSQVVTLVTGDRIRVDDRGQGRRTVAVLPGSPSYGERPLIFGSPQRMYVIPKLSVAERDRLDYSMFDVVALAEAERTNDAVQLRVRFESGSGAHEVAGIDVDTASAERTAGGHVVADATYDPDDVAADPGAWSGVESVRLEDAPRPAAAKGKGRTLTIRLKGRKGNPIKTADAWVLNLDGRRRYSRPVSITNGKARLRVPKGNYAVFAFRRRFLVGRPEFNVTSNRSVRLSLADATVRARPTVKGGRTLDTMVVVSRHADTRGGFEFNGFGKLRIQPMRAKLSHGRLDTLVTGFLSRKPNGKQPNVFTDDAVAGVPRSLTFRHTKSDFARVPVRVYGDGAPRDRVRAKMLVRYDVMGVVDELHGISSWGWSLPVGLPGRRQIWLQADPRIKWDQSVIIHRGDAVAEVMTSRRYRPGPAKRVDFLRSPVGPGIEHNLNGSHTGPRCKMCRDGNVLRGNLSLLSGAGTGRHARADYGYWALRGGGTHLNGGVVIRPKVKVPAKKKRYKLYATSNLGAFGWRLSASVSTEWGFSSRKGKRVVPLLMPSYVPPTDLVGRMRPGEVTYRLDLANLGPVDARVAEASVRYSTDDGASWQKATLDRLDKNSFAVSYANPKPTKGHRYVSLKVRAKDSGGRIVTETASRVYRLVNG